MNNKWYQQGKKDVLGEVLFLLKKERKGYVPESYSRGAAEAREDLINVILKMIDKIGHID